MKRSFPRIIGPLVLVLINVGWCRAHAAPLSADMIVSVPDQVLALVDRGKLIARYSISTSKFGTGDSNASYSHAAWHIVRFSKNRRQIASGHGHQESNSDR